MLKINSQRLEDVLVHCCTTSLCYLGAETDDRVIEIHSSDRDYLVGRLLIKLKMCKPCPLCKITLEKYTLEKYTGNQNLTAAGHSFQKTFDILWSSETP